MPNGKSESGWIEVIAAPMFAGKTEELYRRIKRALIGKQTVRLFHPTRDDRHPGVSHGGLEAPVPIEAVEFAPEIIERLGDNLPSVVGVDEAQFMGPALVFVAEELADRGVRVIVSFLDMTSDCATFGPAGDLLAHAESITKLTAVCADCGGTATRSWRFVNAPGTIVTGGADKYIAVCRRCYHRRSQACEGRR